MTPTLLPATVLVAITFVGVLAVRPLSNRVRVGFDAVCFVAISAFLLRRGVSPIFLPLSGTISGDALWLRAIGGAWWLLGARLSVAALWYSRHRDRRTREAKLFSDLAAAGIYIATALVVLNSVLALPIAGLLATSGVLAIVLGLALQNTLADVFSGIVVGIEAPFSVGDRIQLNDNIEGQVIQVNWRSIRLQTDGEDVAVIPNSVVAKAEIVNRSFPSQRRAVSVELTCPEGSAPERVIETLLQATLLCPAILQLPPPSAVLTRLGARRNAYKISFFVEGTIQLSSTKDMLLRQSRRQLYYAGLLSKTPGGASASAGLGIGGTLHPALPLLRDLVIFECLASEQLSELAAQLEVRVLEPAEILFSQGASDASLYVVASGVLEFTRRTEAPGTEIIGSIGAGEYVGEIGLLTGAPHAATSTARTHCQIYRLSHDAVAPLLAGNAQLAAAFEKAARHGLDILHREVAVRATENIGTRGQLLLRIRNFFRSGQKYPDTNRSTR